MTDVVEKFNKIRQGGSVAEYQRRFEELKALMLNHNPYLTKAYFVSNFISGLNEELKPMVKVLQPQTLKHATNSVRLHELAVEALMKKQWLVSRGGTHNVLTPVGKAQVRENWKGVQGMRNSLPPAPTAQGERLIEQRT